MEIPFLKESIEESLKYLIATTLVLPEQIVIPYYSWYGKGTYKYIYKYKLHLLININI